MKASLKEKFLEKLKKNREKKKKKKNREIKHKNPSVILSLRTSTAATKIKQLNS